ncbi:Cytochrome c oxidase subunit 5A [Tulasnella sp. JGI-2019a]|nr:Cytochrome c oxidase subunit 5A [Tulasnella sp. JGI-2019a]
MSSLRLVRTLNVRSMAVPGSFCRTLATAPTSSMIPVSNIEAQWANLSNKEQMEVYEQLLEVQKKDWKSMSLDEKKAAYYISFGPHGPRKPIDAPGAQWKIFMLTTGIVGAATAAFLLIRSDGELGSFLSVRHVYNLLDLFCTPASAAGSKIYVKGVAAGCERKGQGGGFKSFHRYCVGRIQGKGICHNQVISSDYLHTPTLQNSICAVLALIEVLLAEQLAATLSLYCLRF